MARKPRTKTDPLEREIELAFKPGTFIPDGMCFSYVCDLEQVAAKIDQMVGNEPARAEALYETFLAGCHQKADDLDDSSGSFGQFVGELCCGWVKARQAHGADPDETVSRLLSRMDDDPYGFCYLLEVDVAAVLDRPHLAAFVKQVRARLDDAGKTTAAGDGAARNRLEYVRRRWGNVLRTLYVAQKDVASYIALTQETELAADDCHAIGSLFVARRKPDEALAWVDRGIELDKKAQYGSSAGHDLAKLKRELLVKLGRGNEALEAVWAEYLQYPSTYTYGDLMKLVPRADRAEWREKALEAAADADLHALIELLLATKEIERLADLVRQTDDVELEDLSHYTTEPVAKKLEKGHPGLAARLWLAQGMRIINAGKSKYYTAALSNFRRAKRCFERAGLTAQWEVTVAQVRADHRRKSGFMSGFENLIAGAAPREEPSFLQRAKARWNKHSG